MNWRDKVRVERERLGRKLSFDELLDLAKCHTMTDKEKEEQCQSWVVGEMMIQNPHITRSEAIERYKRASKNV